MVSPFRRDMIAAAQAIEATLPKGSRFVLVAIDMRVGGDLATISNVPSVELSREILRQAAEGEAGDVQVHREGTA